MRLLPPLIPVLAVALDYPLWQLGVLISLYSLGSGLAQAPIGVLSDRYDRQYLLPAGFVVAGFGYVFFVIAPAVGSAWSPIMFFNYPLGYDFLGMCVAMLIVGIGSAVTHPIGYPLIIDNVREKNKGKILGAYGASSKFGDAVAPAAVALLILVLTWEWIVLFVGVGGVLYGGGLYAVIRTDDYITTPSGVRAGHDDSDGLESIDRQSFLYPIIAIYLFFITKMVTTRGIDTFLPAYLVAVYAYSTEFAGFEIGAESVASGYLAFLLFIGAVTQLLLGTLTDTYDSRLVILCCMMAAMVGVASLAFFELNALGLLVVLFITGTGLFGVNPARDTLISDIAPPKREGRTFGYIWTAVSLTGAILPPGIGYVFETVGMRRGLLLLVTGTIFASFFICLLYSDRVYQPNSTKRKSKSD